MTDVLAIPAVPALDDRRGPVALWLAVTAVASGMLALFLHRGVLTTEPVFAVVNIATMVTVTTLGVYLALRHREVFSGACFAVSGLSWSIAVIDVAAPSFGPYVQWTFSGTTYIAIGWAILRYRQRRLYRHQMVFVAMAGALTVGISFLSALVVPPAVLDYPTDTLWLSLTTTTTYAVPALLVNMVCFAVLAVYFTVLLVSKVQSAPPILRMSLRPMAFFGVSVALGSALVESAAMLFPYSFTVHLASTTVGILILALSGGLAASLVLQQMVGSRLVTQLPAVRTPETVTSYLHMVTGDTTSELLYWLPASNRLIDAEGRPRPAEWPPPDPNRFRTWICGSDGDRVALLVGAWSLGQDPLVLDQLSRVLSIIAENARLNVMLHMRIAELAATRAAEKLAFDKAREEFHRNLHDGVQQTIASVRMDFDGLCEAFPSVADDSAAAAIDDKLMLALEQVHNLKRGVDPPELRFGLKPAIDRAVAELRLDAECRVAEADLGVLTLPVYYLVRESLTNVHKHARARRVHIDVTTDGRTIDVRVRDDGVGGAATSTNGGIGGMARRVEELGGRLAVSSVVDNGTTVSASIPCITA